MTSGHQERFHCGYFHSPLILQSLSPQTHPACLFSSRFSPLDWQSDGRISLFSRLEIYIYYIYVYVCNTYAYIYIYTYMYAYTYIHILHFYMSYICHVFFLSSCIKGHLGCFHIMAAGNNAVRNMGAQMVFGAPISDPLAAHPEVRLLDHTDLSDNFWI